MLTASHITTAPSATNARSNRPSDWQVVGVRQGGNLGGNLGGYSCDRLGSQGHSFGHSANRWSMDRSPMDRSPMGGCIHRFSRLKTE